MDLIMPTTIKCGHCGKFIATKALKKCKFIFVPDSDYSAEEEYFICVKCVKKDKL
jgi:hypothetical protein